MCVCVSSGSIRRIARSGDQPPLHLPTLELGKSGFPGGPGVKNQCSQCRRRGFHPRVRKIPWKREWQPTPGFLPGTFYGQKSLAGYSPLGSQSSAKPEHPRSRMGCLSGCRAWESERLFSAPEKRLAAGKGAPSRKGRSGRSAGLPPGDPGAVTLLQVGTTRGPAQERERLSLGPTPEENKWSLARSCIPDF